MRDRFDRGATVGMKAAGPVVTDAMYRAILPDGEIKCDRYEESNHGVDLFDDADQHLAFVPYENLIGILDDEMDTDEDDERSFM